MRWDKDRLERLSENLTFSLNESIYRNALPLQVDRIDIASASIGDHFPVQFIKQILDQPDKDTEIQVNEDVLHKFHHLFLESNNLKKDKGIHTLSLGYPMFIHKNETTPLFPIVAPMFIWEMEMVPSANRPNTWALRRSPNKTIKANRFLLNYLNHNFNLDYAEKFRELIFKKGINSNNISAFCNKLSLELNIDGNAAAHNIIPNLTPDEVKDLGAEPVIHFSGTFGIFENEHSGLAQFINQKIEQTDEEPMFTDTPDSSFIQHPFSLIAPDPCQKNISLHVSEKYITLGEGGPGTGKTTTAIHTATNFLANGGTCLIVSPSASSLEKIHQILSDKYVGNFSMLLKNTEDDLLPLYHNIKKIPNDLKSNIKEQTLSFKILLDRCLGKHSKLEEHHHLMNKKAFGNFDFTDTVGHYISSNRYAGKDILSGRLDASNYKSTFREYDILKTDISKAENLYQKIRKLEHPLNLLHEEIFLEKDAISALTSTKEQIKTFSEKVDDLLRRLSVALESYRDSLTEHYQEFARELNYRVQSMQEKLNEYVQVFGEDFKKSGNVKLKMYGIFSDNFYNIKEARNEIISEFHNLEELYNEKKYFEYKFPKRKDTEKITQIQKYLNDFGQVLNDWTHRIPREVRSETESLNSKSVRIQMDYDSRIGELEYTHDILLEEINQSKLFKEWFSYDGLTLNKRLHSLEELSNSLDAMDYHILEFEDFHPWRKHWLEILPISRDTITALVKSRAKEWLPTFNSWYFYHCLSDRTFIHSSKNDELKNSYVEEVQVLRQKLPEKIRSVWRKKQEETIIGIRKKNKKFHQLLFGKKSQLPSEVKMKDLFLTFSQELPVWFPLQIMTIDVAEEILLHSDIQYDLVIFDDAHAIPTVQAVPIIEKGKRVLALGDRQQSLFQARHTPLMDNLVESGVELIPLYYNHIENERACTEFINQTSYQKGIKKINYFQKPYQHKGISWAKSDGRYNDETRKNNLEAEDIVRILSELPLGKNGKVPKTAIVASTIPQRDHINSYLIYIKQKRNPFSDRILQLEEVGLRVLHVSEIKEHYDTIVWSLTYGSTNLRGHITEHFQDMESSSGPTIINLILGHVRKSLVVCSSIPPEYILERTNDNIKTQGAVMQFLRYAYTVDQKEEEDRLALLESIEWPGIKNDERERYKFMLQVKEELDPYFEADRIKVLSPLSEIGTAALTIIPHNYKQPIPLIIGDGLDRNNPTVAYEFESTIYEELKQAGYLIFKTNSIDWWKNPKKEARILAGKLIKADNTPPEVEAVK